MIPREPNTAHRAPAVNPREPNTAHRAPAVNPREPRTAHREPTNRDSALRWSVFLDRDGVINRKAAPDDYIKSWSEFEWLPGVQESLARLRARGPRLFIATNQQGVARGVMSRADVDDIHRRIREAVALDGIYVCPHLAGTCDCRKPDIGLFQQAKRDFPDLLFERSIVAGDSPSDIVAGKRIGAKTVFIRRDPSAAPTGADAEARDLPGAVDIILGWI